LHFPISGNNAVTMTTASDVIDWDEAMEQCGDDEEFLRELLDDLRGETDAQLAKIEEEIRVSQCSEPLTMMLIRA
jgi:hypothetical protein